jgi:hypothetical protein
LASRLAVEAVGSATDVEHPSSTLLEESQV